MPLRSIWLIQYSFAPILHWLQERFPKAEYEDVTGLCKAASLSDIEEQDYSLNPGRYVGVVIEEDGMTEEEFFGEWERMNTELTRLNEEANNLSKVIALNTKELLKDA